MIKDYIYESIIECLPENEDSFIERHWSDIWRGKELNLGALNETIGNRAELAIMQKYLQAAGKSTKILDAGCGLGNWTAYFALEGYDVTGIDISKEVIQRLQTSGVPGVYQHGDVRRTGFSDNHFDFCFSWGVFEHFESGPDECFKEAFRILKPGGYLFASVPFQNLRHARKNNRIVTKDEKNVINSTGYNYNYGRFYQWRLSESELYQQASLAGFQTKDIHRLDKGEGVKRILANFCSSPHENKISRFAVTWLLSVLLPSRWVSHMIMVVAQKPIL